MRAVVHERPGDESVLTIAEVPPPPLGPGEIRIAVTATAVNRADLLQRRGLYPPPAGASSILGLECAGVVREVAPDVTALPPGARVMALLAGGGYAEEAVVHAGSVLPVPDSMSDAAAGAFMETFLTAFSNVFLLGGAAAGQTVLVHGGGSGVGTAAVTLCKEAGVRVIVTAGGPEKVARCLEHGADVAIDYRAGDFAQEVLDATGGEGVSVVLDSIGASYLRQNLACLRSEGRLVLIGLMGGGRGDIDLATVLRKRVQLIGSTLRSRPTAAKAEIVARFQERFGEALARGRLQPVVHAVLPLEQVAAAHALVQASAHFGKVVLAVSG